MRQPCWLDVAYGLSVRFGFQLRVLGYRRPSIGRWKESFVTQPSKEATALALRLGGGVWNRAPLATPGSQRDHDLPSSMAALDVAEGFAGSAEGDWRLAMRRRATSAQEVLLRHPWATMLIVSRVDVGPAMLRYVDATIGCLRAAGFSYRMADHAWNAVDNHVYGFTLQKLNFPLQPEEYARAAKAFLPQIPEDKYPYLNGLSQQVIDGKHDGMHDFQFGLELILGRSGEGPRRWPHAPR